MAEEAKSQFIQRKLNLLSKSGSPTTTRSTSGCYGSQVCGLAIPEFSTAQVERLKIEAALYRAEINIQACSLYAYSHTGIPHPPPHLPTEIRGVPLWGLCV